MAVLSSTSVPVMVSVAAPFAVPAFHTPPPRAFARLRRMMPPSITISRVPVMPMAPPRLPTLSSASTCRSVGVPEPNSSTAPPPCAAVLPAKRVLSTTSVTTCAKSAPPPPVPALFSTNRPPAMVKFAAAFTKIPPPAFAASFRSTATCCSDTAPVLLLNNPPPIVVARLSDSEPPVMVNVLWFAIQTPPPLWLPFARLSSTATFVSVACADCCR
jgi:hypothetical protein